VIFPVHEAVISLTNTSSEDPASGGGHLDYKNPVGTRCVASVILPVHEAVISLTNTSPDDSASGGEHLDCGRAAARPYHSFMERMTLFASLPFFNLKWRGVLHDTPS